MLLKSIRENFDSNREPNNITIIFTSSTTDPGIDHLAHPELLSCSYEVIMAIPKVRKLIESN